MTQPNRLQADLIGRVCPAGPPSRLEGISREESRDVFSCNQPRLFLITPQELQLNLHDDIKQRINETVAYAVDFLSRDPPRVKDIQSYGVQTITKVWAIQLHYKHAKTVALSEYVKCLYVRQPKEWNRLYRLSLRPPMFTPFKSPTMTSNTGASTSTMDGEDQEHNLHIRVWDNGVAQTVVDAIDGTSSAWRKPTYLKQFRLADFFEEDLHNPEKELLSSLNEEKFARALVSGEALTHWRLFYTVFLVERESEHPPFEPFDELMGWVNCLRRYLNEAVAYIRNFGKDWKSIYVDFLIVRLSTE